MYLLHQRVEKCCAAFNKKLFSAPCAQTKERKTEITIPVMYFYLTINVLALVCTIPNVYKIEIN